MTQAKPRSPRTPRETSRKGKASKETRSAGNRSVGFPEGLTEQDLLNSYRQMVLVRKTDERVWMMNRQGKCPLPPPARATKPRN